MLCRVAYLSDLEKNPFFDYVPPAFDQYNFDQGAQNFARGDWLARSPNNQYSPVYKYFLGSIYWCVGRNFSVVFFVQFLLGSLSAVLVFLIGKSLFDYRVGLAASLVFSLYGPNLFYEGILLRECLAPFFALLSLYLLIRLRENPSTFTAILGGASLSLFLQNRPSVLFVFPLLYFYCKELKGPVVSARLRLMAGTFLVFSLLGLLQCYWVHHRFVFFDDSGPITLLTGNVTDFPGSEWTATPLIEKFRRTNRMTYPNVLREILRGAVRDPEGFLALYGRKIYYLFHAHEFPSNVNYYLFQEFSPLLRTPWSRFSIFTSLGLVGMVLGMAKFRRFLLLYCFFTGISLSIILVYVPGRFRLPLIPIMMLFAAYAVSRFAACLKEGRVRQAALLLVSSLVLFLVFDQDIPGPWIRDIDYVHLGEAYGQRGERQRALAGYEMAARMNPYNQNAYQGILAVLQAEGRTQRAIQALEEGRKKAPGMDFLSYKLAELSFNAGRYGEAEAVYREILVKHPQDAQSRNNFAVVLVKRNRKAEAMREFKRALELRPGWETARKNLAKLKE